MGYSHIWHHTHSFNCKELLGVVSCHVCSKLVGIGCCERTWSDLKLMRTRKRFHVYNEK